MATAQPNRERVADHIKIGDADVLLVTSAPTPAVTPFAGTGYLAAALSEAGITSDKLDLGQVLASWILESGSLRAVAELDPNVVVTAETRSGSQASLTAGEVASGAVDASKAMRSPYRNLNQHRSASEIVRSAFPLFSRMGNGGLLTLGAYEHPWGNLDLPEILNRLIGPEDIFASFIREVSEAVGRRSYRLIAISISHADQLLPALALAKALKLGDFPGKIVFGGVQISFLLEKLLETPSFFRYVDAAVPKMGETTIVELARAAVRNAGIEGIENLVVCDVGGAVRHNRGYVEPRLGSLPPPDYSGLALGDYLVPAPTLPLRTATKCYWGKCKFCRITGDQQFDRPDIARAETIYRDMRALYARHGALNFVMADDATSPRLLTLLSKMIIEDGFAPRWTCVGLRPEEAITDQMLALWKRAGCSSLAIGFESGSQRLVDLMAKGQKVGTVERILRACHDLEIITFCYGFYGHPLETENDLSETIAFKRRNENYASYFAAGRWLLSPYNLDFQQTSDLNITVRSPPHFPWGRDYWLDWDSERRASHEQTISRMLSESGHVPGPRNYLSDWVYWGQAMHIPYSWVSQASRGAV